MAKLDSKHSSIFFHMGPGFHSQIEAQVFSSEFPHIAFLDQPTELDLSQLISWAVDSIRNQYRITNQPLVLLGHSFGAQIITRALPEVKGLIKEVRFLNSAYDSFDCFANLESTLSPSTARGASQWKSQSVEAKLNLIFQLVQNPDLPSAYWFNPQARKNYESLASQYPPLNVETFIRVFSEYLATPDVPLATKDRLTDWSGSLEVFYSKEDRLIQTAETVTAWNAIFPRVQYREFPDLGHYALYESPQLVRDFLR